MDFNKINKQLKKLSTACSVSDAHELIASLVSPLGITESKSEELLIHPSIQREISRFVKAPGFRNQAAAYEIHHDSKLPIDLKLFWLHKTTKANLSWLVALTPNYEDNPENNPNANIGIDFVLSEECDRLFVVLSKNLKLRVLELHESLSHTQREIFENWVTFANKLDKESDTYKEQLQHHLWKSFDFEPTNRKFYQELVTQFDHLVSHLKEKITEEEAKIFAVRFIGRTLFLWFLRKKEFINKDKNYFEVGGASDQTKYYRSKLEPLFFEVLNTEAKARTYDDKATPFLNGGLFEPIETDFYKDEKLTFPDGFFTQFYSLLDHYNFTVDEGTSEYEHVAVDPEMLGRVFENLLASINEETGKQARKAKGAFYTPREIVDYMCQQSLVEYLKTKLPETTNRDRRIEELVTMNEPEFREQDHNKRRDWKKDLGKEDIVKALDAIRVLDPAVGSGAFPMGMLTLLVKVYSRIDTTREKDLSKLKREILSQSLYGVDIDQMAIQISRLRAWLSMLVDMESLKKVEPLPNLDFKFVCANTLIPLDEGPNSLFDSDIDLKNKLIELRDQYYQATRKTEKNKIRKEYLNHIQTGNLFASEREKQLKDYDPFNSLNSSRFYDPSLMHGVEAFDVVIANPPYVRIHKQNQNKEYKKFIKKYYITAYKDFDVYVLFFEKALSLVSEFGVVVFITPDKYLIRDYGSRLRQLILNTKIVELFDISRAIDAFDAATYPLITILQKTKPSSEIKTKTANTINNLFKNYSELNIETQDCLKKDLIEIIDPKAGAILDKIFSNGVTLSKILEKGQLFCGTPRAKDYHEWKNHVTTNARNDDCLRLLVCSNLKPYSIDTQKKIRTVGLSVTAPYLCNSKKIISDTRWNDFKAKPKILIRGNDTRVTAVYDSEGSAFVGVYGIKLNKDNLNKKLLLALLNSNLYQYVFGAQNPSLKIGGGYFSINAPQILRLPYPKSRSNYDSQIEEVVNTILDLKNSKPDADISDLEHKIDELVMDLYGLNKEEKEIIRKS